MDKLAQAAVTWNTSVLKEPKCFIKFIQVVIAIFAFATSTSVSTSSSFSVTCQEGSEPNIQEIKFGYPFKLNNYVFEVPYCNATAEKSPVSPYGDFSAPAQFYVFVGVMAFLYSIGAVILYVCFDDKYRKYDLIPIGDFVISIVFTMLWLIASAAWADGVSKVKRYTDPKELWYSPNDVAECTKESQDLGVITCAVTSQGNFASLNVSIIFGFLNMCVWGGNLWFLFKETKWFKVKSQHPEQRTDPVSPSETQEPQRV